MNMANCVYYLVRGFPQQIPVKGTCTQAEFIAVPFFITLTTQQVQELRHETYSIRAIEPKLIAQKIKINLNNNSNTYWSTIDLFALAEPEGV